MRLIELGSDQTLPRSMKRWLTGRAMRAQISVVAGVIVASLLGGYSSALESDQNPESAHKFLSLISANKMVTLDWDYNDVRHAHFGWHPDETRRRTALPFIVKCHLVAIRRLTFQ